jgi:isopenicillin-N epimerase
MFDWVGTADPSAWLSLPKALEFMAGLVEGGWPAVRARNHQLALYARDALCRALGIDPPAPNSMLGSLAAVPLPASPTPGEGALDPLYDRLVERGFETLVVYWPSAPERVLRVSAQLYNRRDEYDQLAALLPELLVAG